MGTAINISVWLIAFGMIFALGFAISTYHYLYNEHRSLFIAGTVGIGCGVIFLGFMILITSLISSYFKTREFSIEGENI